MCLANHKITQISTRFPGTIGKSECYHCICKFYRRARGLRSSAEGSTQRLGVVLKLRVLCAPRGDKSLDFQTVPISVPIS